MPDVLPTINNEPAQGIQATLDTVYLWNPDVANELIEQINVLLEELEEISGSIRPYSELEAPVKQYVPMFYGDGLYVAAEDIEELPTEPDLSDWILVATKATDLVAGSGIVIHNGVISVTQAISEGAAAGATAVQPEDLGTAAYAATTDFATSAQGGKADTAVQPSDLGTAAYAAATDFATSAQGAKADTALQPGSSVPQYSTMPVASADNLGEIVQYVGASASGYATGYFYKCVNNDNVYTWENIDVQAEPNIGRFLSLWNCATGLAETNPPQSPYTYRAGDYFIVGTVSSATPAVNYKPNGSSYVIGTASSAVESGEVYAGDSYFFDGTNWRLQSNTTRTVTFANIAGDIYDNANAAGALNAKQDALVSGTNIKTINGNSVLGSGNMEVSTFLPYPAGWTTNSTTKAFCDDIAADTTAVIRKAYLGEVTLSDMPAGIGNAEIEVKIMDGTTAANKVIVLTLTSGSVAPYAWIYTYWNGGLSVSGWQPMGGMVQSVNSKTGAVVLDAKDVNALPQYSTLPTASSSNSGDIVQYTGVTIPEAEASATISQTTGSSLTDLAVDVETFEAEEQPSGAETVAFTASVTPDSMVFTTVVGNTTFSITNPRTFKDYMTNTHSSWYEGYANAVFRYSSDFGEWLWLSEDMTGQYGSYSTAQLEEMGIVITGALADGDTISYVYTDAIVSWSKNSETVDISDYGITYSGEPVTGDVLTVNYLSAVEGRDHAYIYENVPKYSEPAATVSQTVGSGLTDLAIDVDTFVETEQPTGDETVNFVASVSQDDIQIYDKTPSLELTVDSVNTFIQKFETDTGLALSAISHNGDCYFSYQNDIYNPSGWAIIYPGGWQSVADLSLWGFTLANEPRSYDCFYVLGIPEGTSWYKGGVIVNLSDYGVSYSGGSPEQGDTLTVRYTAPFIIGYGWNRVDVQPNSGGGDSGIKWVESVDLPSEYSGDIYNAAPFWTIVGGLPDGTYEYYFSTKTTTDGNLTMGEVIFKVLFYIDNENYAARGKMGYVFNGDYKNDANNVFGEETFWNFIRGNGDDTIIYCSQRPFASAALAYNERTTIPECFKISAIKNVDTGEEYIPVGSINLNGSEPSFTRWYDCQIKLERLSPVQTIPMHTCYASGEVQRFDTQAFSFSSRATVSTLTVVHKETNSEFIVKVLGENQESPSVDVFYQEIVKATGIFANCYMASKGEYVWMMGVDTAAASTSSGTVWAFLTSIVVDNGTTSLWFDYFPSSGLIQASQFGAQGAKLHDITAKNLGNVIQYTGPTNANYTNGYFYKATGTIVHHGDSMVFSNYSLQDVTVSLVSPLSDFISAIAAMTGWSTNDVKRNLQSYNSMYVEFNADENNAIISLYWNAYGGIRDSNVLSCLSVTTTPGSFSGYCTVYFTETYTPEHDEVTNQAWERVDVQPGGGGGSVPTLTWYSVSTAGNTLTIADTSSATLVKIYKNGLLLEPTADYSISGTTLTMVTALVVGDKITTEVF